MKNIPQAGGAWRAVISAGWRIGDHRPRAKKNFPQEKNYSVSEKLEYILCERVLGADDPEAEMAALHVRLPGVSHFGDRFALLDHVSLGNKIF